MLKLDRAFKVFNPGTLNEVVALDRVNLEVPDGQFVVVIGSNGSGKSTIQNIVAGTFPPDAGKVIVDGKNITEWPEHRRARLIGRVFQNPFSGTAPNMTIAENLSLALKRGRQRWLGWALRRDIQDRFREMIKGLNLGLEDRLHTEIGVLSGGQRQALTLLMATCLEPRLLLLDEHTAALDPKSAEQIIEMTENIVRRDKLTTLMVTHSMHQAVTFGDRLIMMHRGRIRLDVSGEGKKSLTINDLLDHFDSLRREEHLSEHSTELVNIEGL
ncbi:MAG: ATP-binding cassette domain-containing protein [Candidatus Sumerlaeia bacterium]|nr:ATP-binding cassette domain-containing protein [Candidatus Sumerlaeia bacterium]